ncbi:MAG: hypothetical protein ACK55I_32960, partial [bacterium]
PHIEAGGERFAVVLDHRHDHAVDHHQRGRHPQRVAGVGIVAPEPAEPQQAPVEVEGRAVVGREDRVDGLAVRGRCRRRRPDLLVGHRAPRRPELPLPERCAVGQPEAQHMEPVLTGAAGGCDEHLVADDE